MDLGQAAESYLSQFPGFSRETGAPTAEEGAQAMNALVRLAAQCDAPADGKFKHLDQIVGAVGELAPQSAMAFDKLIVENPEQKETAKALEIAMIALEKRSPETWKHILHHAALTMLYYEHKTGLDKSGGQPNVPELMTLMVGALGHDVGKIGIDPKLLHKSMRVDGPRFNAALEQYRKLVPDYPEKSHDTIFLEEANMGKIIFADEKSVGGAQGAKPLILDIGKDQRRSEEYWVGNDERQRHNAIWQRINQNATQYVKEGWLTADEQKALTMAKRGTVTAEEMKIIETHDAMSEAFFAAAPMPPALQNVKDVVSMDRFRAAGVVQQSTASKIAEVIHTADVFEAITGDRAYRKPYTVEEALKVMDGMAKDGKVNAVVLADMKASGAIGAYAEAVGLQHSSDLQPVLDRAQTWTQKVGRNISSALPVWAQLARRDNNAGIAASLN